MAIDTRNTPVAQRKDWLDRVGAFWLVACAFGPLVGWTLTSFFPLTLASWRWLYGGRVALAVALPLLTALPLLRYVRGRGAPIMLALLIGVTALPVWSGWATLQDLLGAPANRPVAVGLPGSSGDGAWYLPHTDRALEDP